MRNRLSLFALSLSLLTLAGCLDAKIKVHVRKDGSARLTVETFQAEMELGGLGKPNAKPLDVEAWRAQAKAMGEGVALESVEEVVDEKSGWKGAKAIYTIEDITKLKLRRTLSDDNGVLQLGPAEGADPITFAFQGGKNPQLSITHPNLKPAGKAPTREQLGSMKAIFTRLHVRMLVRVAGKITNTNAKYINRKKTSIALLDVNLGKIAKDDALFARFVDALAGAQDPNEAMKKASAIKGFKVEDSGKVIEISFR